VAGQGDLIGVLQFAAHRQPVSTEPQHQTWVFQLNCG
jgi:hypothetical protein